MIRYYITDSRALGGVDGLVRNIRRVIGLNLVDWIQIREKELSVRALIALVREAVALSQGSGVRILVNSRLDVALAAGANGLHLPSGMPPPREWKRLTPPGFTVGVSCHDLAELTAARHGGSDFAVLGPVFAPLSKASDREPLGVDRFGELARRVSPMPVLALGGIRLEHTAEIQGAGGAGIAGISLFQH